MAKNKRVFADTNLTQGTKKPASVVDVGAKRPFSRAPSLEESNENLCWRFSMMDRGGSWCFTAADKPKLLEVLDKLQQFEQFKWAQLSKEKHHRVERSRLVKPAQDRLKQLKLDDVDHLCSFRLSGEERVWGILHGHIIYILWWDPGHAVCPAIKRHT